MLEFRGRAGAVGEAGRFPGDEPRSSTRHLSGPGVTESSVLDLAFDLPVLAFHVFIGAA